MSEIQKIEPGKRIGLRSESWNDVVDATQEYQRGRGRGFPKIADNLPGPATILLSNGSGGNVPLFGILAIDLVGSSPPITPSSNLSEFQQRQLLSGGLPDGPGAFAVALESMASGGIGRAAVAGVVQCLVNVSDTTHHYAAPGQSDTAKLTSQSDPQGAARIIWKESGTGIKWALIVLPVNGFAPNPYFLQGGSFTFAGGDDLTHYPQFIFDEVTNSFKILGNGLGYSFLFNVSTPSAPVLTMPGGAIEFSHISQTEVTNGIGSYWFSTSGTGFAVGSNLGVNGTFQDKNSNTVHVTGGIITSLT